MWYLQIVQICTLQKETRTEHFFCGNQAEFDASAGVEAEILTGLIGEDLVLEWKVLYDGVKWKMAVNGLKLKMDFFTARMTDLKLQGYGLTKN